MYPGALDRYALLESIIKGKRGDTKQDVVARQASVSRTSVSAPENLQQHETNRLRRLSDERRESRAGPASGPMLDATRLSRADSTRLRYDRWSDLLDGLWTGAARSDGGFALAMPGPK